jgi:hypothetical protein
MTAIAAMARWRDGVGRVRPGPPNRWRTIRRPRGDGGDGVMGRRGASSHRPVAVSPHRRVVPSTARAFHRHHANVIVKMLSRSKAADFVYYGGEKLFNRQGGQTTKAGG